MKKINKNRVEEIYPLTPLQQGLMFHSMYAPQSGFYVVQFKLRLEQLDKEAFQRAWQQVVNRHEILRTAFVSEGLNEPLQVVLRGVTLPWHEQDWRAISEAEAEQKLEEYLEWDRAQGYDFTQAPLMRVALMRVGEGEYHFVWSHHHVLLDGWSIPMLIKEVAALYESYREGRELELAKPRAYRDYIAWLAAQDEREAERFWREELKGISEPTKLGIDNGAGATTEPKEFDEQQIKLGEELTGELQTLARQQQLTLNTIIQGAWALLLGRYSGESRVMFGTTVAGRPADLSGVERMVGLFINTVPLSVEVEEGEPVVSWLKEIQRKHVGIRQYEHSPLVKIQGWSDVPRGLPLFESILAFENYPVDASLMRRDGDKGLKAASVQAIEKPHYPLTVVVLPGQSLTIKITHDCTRYTADSVKRMLSHLRELLTELAASPTQPLALLDPLSESERIALLAASNHATPNATAAPTACLHELFEQQAARTPDSIALTFEGRDLTYGQLNARANRLARTLRGRGVGPDSLVAVYLERSAELVVAMLGVLKAGGAYVPIDPATPRERLEYLLEDAGVAAVVTQESLRAALPESAPHVLTLDTNSDLRTLDTARDGLAPAMPSHDDLAADDINLASVTTSANLAYVIYTSGSTGRPKGVMVTHHNVTRLLSSSEHSFGFGPHDVWTLFHSAAFDFSVWELYGALLYGGRLVVVPYWVSRSPEAMLRLVSAERVTVLNQTPSAFLQLMRADEATGEATTSESAAAATDAETPATTASAVTDSASSFSSSSSTSSASSSASSSSTSSSSTPSSSTSTPAPTPLSLRLVIFGGEALDPRSLRPWFARRGDSAPLLVNMYGITETTVHVTLRPLSMADSDAASSVIGDPLPDLELYVLDGHGRLAPTGVSGELYVGGPGLARGYLGRSALTAERFVPHPFSQRAGARLYRTGDVARRTEAGELEYLGRNDEQVKIRGFRIETGEIEAALLERAEVGQAVVLVKEEEGRGKQLSAFVVASNGVEPSGRELREYLQTRLPDYMVPGRVAVVTEMPLTANGKLDRRALLALGGVGGGAEGRSAEGGDYEAAREGVEQALARIWAEVLGVERVGRHENFFELGGDSILSIQLVGKAARAGMAVGVQEVFRHQTVAELAAVISATAGAKTEQEEAKGEVGLTPIQLRFFAQQLPNPHHFNQAVMLETDARIEVETLTHVIGKLVAHHDALRLRFTETEEGWRQSYADAGETSDTQAHGLVTRIDLSHLAGDAQAQRRELEAQAAAAQATLDLTSGPLMRVVLFEMGEEEAMRLLIAVHHLVIDGVSWRVLLEDLQTAYTQAQRGESLELPARTSSFKRWADGLRKYAASEELRSEAGYWLDARREQVSQLPLDYEGGENTAASSQSVEVKLTREETRALLQEVPRAYHTQVQEALAAALALAFKRWTGDARLLVDMEGHGREEIAEAGGEGLDVSRTVGWFTSVYPVLLELDATETDQGEISSALKGVKEQLRGVPGRGVGYGVLRYLNADAEVRERLAAMPAAEVSFNYLGQFDQVLSGGEFRAAQESVGAVVDERGRREHVIAVNGLVADGRLRMSLGYSVELHRRETIEGLAEGFALALREVIKHCQSEGAGGHTPSDFPLARLDQASLDSLLMEFEEFQGVG